MLNTQRVIQKQNETSQNLLEARISNTYGQDWRNQNRFCTEDTKTLDENP